MLLKRLTVLFLVFCSLTGAAQARTLPLVNPKPNDPADPISCWSWFPVATTTVGLTRTCAGTFAVDFPLPVDDAGTYSVIVTAARDNTTAQISCNAFTVTSTGGYVPGRVVNIAGGPGFKPIDLGTMAVSAGSTLWVRCLAKQGTHLLMVDWNWVNF